MAKKPEIDVEAKATRYSVQIDNELRKKIMLILTTHDGMSVPDYVNNRLAVIVEEEYQRTIDAMGLIEKAKIRGQS